MANFAQYRDPVRLMKRRLIILGLLLLAVIAIRGIWGVYQKEQESRLLRKEAEAQLANMMERESGLRGDIAKLKSDRGMEEVLREEYELAKTGEGVIVIVDKDEPPSPTEPTSFERFKSWFGW